MKGKRQPGSGNRWYARGDIRANGFLVDDKFTDANSFSITKAVWQKIEREAAQSAPPVRPSLRIHIPGLPTLRVVIEDDLLYHMADNADSN